MSKKETVSMQLTPKPFTLYTIKTGVVLMSFPNFGITVVRTDSANADKLFICRSNNNGGAFGAGLIDFPSVGSSVTFTVIPNTDKGLIISKNPLGKLLPSYTVHNFLHGYLWDIPLQHLSWINQFKQDILKIDKKLTSTPCGATLDTFSGDYIICDKQGPSIFCGRLQTTIKASDLSYTLFSGIDNKITTVALSTLLNTLSDKTIYSTNINKYLKAASIKLGLGVVLFNSSKPLKILLTAKLFKIKTTLNILPIYRVQEFCGGSVKGDTLTVIAPLDLSALQICPVYFSSYNYYGNYIQQSATGLQSIKTTNVPGIQDLPLTKQEAALTYILQLKTKLKQLPDTDNAVNRALQIDKLYSLSLDSGILLQGIVDTESLDTFILLQIVPSDKTLKNTLDWNTSNAEIYQLLPIPEYAVVSNNFDSAPSTVYNNTSFITQLPDGSIIIKDGYGSSIIMSRGNIYISSALDTFIRPGRDLISLVPHRVLTTADDLIVIASKKDVKVASLQSTYITSAVSGNQGYTVILNKAVEQADNSGVILRSNGNMSITASKDMRIGLNDKRTKNAKEGITEGEGSIIISANQLSLGSKQAMNIISGGALGLYAYQDSTGAGINIGINNITIVGLSVMLDTGYTAVAHTSTKHEITSSDGKTKITLNSGSGDSLLHVRGLLHAQGAVFRLDVQIGGQLGAGNYFIWRKNQLLNIPGVSTLSIKSFHDSLTGIFGFNITSLPPTDVSVNQNWYNDSYICDRLLSFKDSEFSGYVMPTMCWQILPVLKDYLIFKPVSATVTGLPENITYTYPGKQAWLNGHITSIDDSTYLIKDSLITLKGGYKTNTKKEK